MCYGLHFLTSTLIALFMVRRSSSHPLWPADNEFDFKYGWISEDEITIAREQAKQMFYFGYDNYLNHAFPLDELDPIHCTGRGPDYAHPENININDVLGDYSLTLIDTLDALVVFQNKSEFHRAVRLVIDTVSFEKNVTVQVFEATIRVVGSLLSAHMILTNENSYLGDYSMPDYDGELLTMAHDIVLRMLPAFDNTLTGLPYPRVNLVNGVLPGTINETCTAGAGSLILEFGVLSRLLDDSTFEILARKTNARLWNFRDKHTGLLGNVIDVQTGEWKGTLSGLGAGLDSFYEYMLKAYILFGDERDLKMYLDAQDQIWTHMRKGRTQCRSGDGQPPIYVNVDMRDGKVLDGMLDEAICFHALYYAVWKKYGALPERYNWHLKAPDVSFYPLRPEFIESTYLLYRATKSPFYLHVGREIMDSLNMYSRVRCGFATVHDVIEKSLEDRMESFFLSETSKYLYLLFDDANPVNKNYHRLLFTTEGHIFPISDKFRDAESLSPILELNVSCQPNVIEDKIYPPLTESRFNQIFKMMGYYGDDVNAA
ncbi:hypothetical protein QR680_003433 [Steinernema hermaphroditum]|uniref:alpha-1,2-Mannosidase n=1 Tax=Steinernema hermaphroditum TaxID=289476 RepID=A0AA39H8L8_9BILA|nr:hypothetical protein QR680_003433 [Steinernema hermaphroditum]